MKKPVNLALKIWPAVLGMLIVIAINRFEYFALPVVTGFTITEMAREEDRIQLSGYMRKDRDCTFAGVSAKSKDSEGNKVHIPLVFNDNKRDATGTRPVGTQNWGPWSIEIPLAPAVSEVTLTSFHQCHMFWATSSHLITFPIINTDINK